MLTYPGQPAYELHPYADNKFHIRRSRNYYVKFHIDKKSVTGMSFIQPNGIINAKGLKRANNISWNIRYHRIVYAIFIRCHRIVWQDIIRSHRIVFFKKI